MRVNNKMRFMPILLMLSLVFMMAVPMTASVVYAVQTTVPLGTASNFGVLAGSTITNTGPTIVEGSAGGNIGLHPGTAITGLDQMTVTSAVYGTDPVAIQAKDDLSDAYINADIRGGGITIDGDLGGQTLTPGLYTSGSTIGLTGILTLDAKGDPGAVFVFQVGSALTTLSGSEIRLINGAQACNVFWQVTSYATLGTGSIFVGHILASESITAATGAEVYGQLLAMTGAVTLDNNLITNNACSSTGLRVTKSVQGPVNNMTLPDFEITLEGPNGYRDTQSIESGSSYTWIGLASGSYTVSERALSQWNAIGTGPYEVSLNGITEVTIINHFPDSSDNDRDDNGNGTKTTSTTSTPTTPEEIDERPVAELPVAELPGDTPPITPVEPQPVESPVLDSPAEVTPVLPQTGDKSPLAFYLGGLLLVAGGLIIRRKDTHKTIH